MSLNRQKMPTGTFSGSMSPHKRPILHRAKESFVWLEYLPGPCNLTVSLDSKENAQIKLKIISSIVKLNKSLQFPCNISFGWPKLHSVHLVSGNQKSLLYFPARVDYSVSAGTLSTLISYALAMIKVRGKKRGTYLRVQQDIFWFQIPGNTRTLNLLAFCHMEQFN